MIKIILVVTLVASGGAGTSMVAENSLPEDALYAVKVNVNERARAAVAFSAEAKADWDIRRAERRMEEAEALAQEGRLTAETRANLQSRFNAHVDSVEVRISNMEQNANFSAAAETSARAEGSLRAHERVLVQLRDTRAETETEIDTILSDVRQRVDAMSEIRAAMEASINAQAEADVRVAAEGRMRSAQQKINEVQAHIDRQEARAGAEAVAEAEANATLEVAREFMAEGEAHMEAGAYASAFNSFQSAHMVAQEAMLIVNTNANMNLDIRAMDRTEIEAGFERTPRDEQEEEREDEDRSEEDEGGDIGVEVEAEAEAELEIR